MESKYEQIINKAKTEGRYKVYDSPEDMEMMNRLNEVSAEIREESKRKQIASEIECSKIYLD